MKNRILSAALSLCLCLGLTVPACAAGPTFSDVPSSRWSYRGADFEAAHSNAPGLPTFSTQEWERRRTTLPPVCGRAPCILQSAQGSL